MKEAHMRSKLVKKVFCVAIVALLAWPLFSQEYLLEGELYSTVTRMEGGGYSLQLKETGVFEKITSTGGGYVLDPDPFGYRDFVPPSRPAGVRATALDAATVRVSYLAATDNIRIVGYRVYRDGSYVGFTSEERFTDESLTEQTTYYYTVEAVDKSLNVSELSDGVYATTLDATTQDNPPQFTGGPSVGYVTHTLGVISFTANKAVTATVEYGLDTSYGSSVTTSDYLIEQIVAIAGLNSSKLYHYRVTIDGYSMNGPVTSDDDSFYTLAGSDSTLPQFVAGPEATYVSDTIATIAFETDEDTQGFILYGTDSIYENRADEPYYDIEHYVTLYGLDPMTSYSYEVSVVDRSYNGPVTSAVRSFTTAGEPDTTPPVFRKKPKAAYRSDRLAIIVWDTDEPSNSVVRYGTSRGVFDRQVVSHDMTEQHMVILPNLEPHTHYYFTALSTDPSGNETEWDPRHHGGDDDDDDDHDDRRSAKKSGGDDDGDDEDDDWNGVLKFVTYKHPDTKAPKIKHIEVTKTSDSATISWDTDELTESKVAYGTASGWYTLQKYDAKLREDHQIRLSGLLSGTKYYFLILAKDPSDNEAQAPENSFRTKN